MEAVCLCVRKPVTSLTLFFFSPLKNLSLSLTSTILVAPCHSFTRCRPASRPNMHPTFILSMPTPSTGSEADNTLTVCVCVCVCACACLSVSSSMDEIWAAKYECWVVFLCHVATSLMHRGAARARSGTQTHMLLRWKRSSCRSELPWALLCIAFARHLSEPPATHTRVEAGLGFRLQWL